MNNQVNINPKVFHALMWSIAGGVSLGMTISVTILKVFSII